MSSNSEYKEVNKKLWNTRADIHLQSDFYDVDSFIAGKNVLNSIELNLLGDIKGKRILHLQCHFGMDTISLERMGASVIGVDLSDRSIEIANDLALKCNSTAKFICSDIYDLPQHLNEEFDIVFTSYGTIGWLPDIDKWAAIVFRYLKPNGRFVFAEFHPVVWMFDADFKNIAYDYFNTTTILETETDTYADRNSNVGLESISWNHDLGEVLNALIKAGLVIESFQEFDYSPYNCFKNSEEFEAGKFRIKHIRNLIPMVYAISALKKD